VKQQERLEYVFAQGKFSKGKKCFPCAQMT